MASGTTWALPSPTPTCPLPSPTTTRAVKENRRPPFTTLATRLIVTTRSVSSSTLASIFASATLSPLVGGGAASPTPYRDYAIRRRARRRGRPRPGPSRDRDTDTRRDRR